jgi:hypothetical protein
MRKNHFHSLFKVEDRVNIVDIVRVALFFLKFLDEDGNKDLFVDVFEDELKEVLHSFQKDKNSGPRWLANGTLCKFL